MQIDSLPYFLQLIKQNILLHAIIASGGFSNIDLKNIEHNIFTEKAIVFYNFSLSSNDSFEYVNFSIIEDVSNPSETIMEFSFLTRDSKYFENTKHYFNENENSPIKNHPLIKKKRLTRKDIGFIKIFDSPVPPADVSISKNTTYGYSINLTFYSDFKAVKERMQKREEAILNSKSQ